MNRIFGHVLLWLGFLSAAFWACYQLEIEGNKWATVPWQWYLLSMVVGLGGVMILRSTAKIRSVDSTRTDANYAVIESSLGTLIKGVAHLQQFAKKEDVRSIVRYIDDELTEPFADFADAREALTNRHGLQFFAEVMTQFASAERFVNRAWSAAADGYIDEVNDSLALASVYLAAAQELISTVESGA